MNLLWKRKYVQLICHNNSVTRSESSNTRQFIVKNSHFGRATFSIVQETLIFYDLLTVLPDF